MEQFIDTPVKRYSSGMYLRLAFAVAAHLEPEILVVDEVLAVGDAEFQRKCLGKMSDVARQGRTVLFVSHNMSAILRLTEETLVIEKGGLAMRAPTAEAVGLLSLQGFSQEGQRTWLQEEVPVDAAPFRRSPSAYGTALAGHRYDALGGTDFVEIEYDLAQPITGLRVGIYLHQRGEYVFTSFDTDEPEKFEHLCLPPGWSLYQPLHHPGGYLE